ncbi:hypothetical protein F2Q70_00039418 [Brassica cretica]|uniref:Fanconi anemia group D2 protein homolog n=1 Tax=Brassica cretica TaxID=69181 RepID=A0A8S9KD39_BRACR|nr:hypothetical protein F2Q70_00039418 [Brassica cretica]
MVFLSRKKPPPPPPSSSSAPPPPSSSSAAPSPKFPQPQKKSAVEPDAVEKMTAILAEAGCTLNNPYGPPCLPSDLHAFRRHLTTRFSSCSASSAERDSVSDLCSVFVAGFSSYIQSPSNLRRVLSTCSSTKRDDSLVRNLLLVSPIQLDLQETLLEKLPEYFDVVSGCSLQEDVARLIINHFRWLDFIVNPDVFTDKLMEVLSISPPHLKKEIIGSLPEIIGDHISRAVVDSLEKMLQEDSSVVVPVLDSFSNLNLDDQLQEQALTVAISCIRTIDAEHMPYLLRFLLLAATQANVRRIISQIRQQLKFTGISQPCASQNKLKGKAPAYNSEGSILHALRSSLRFKNILCQEIIKELNGLEKPRDFKVIDIWLLILMYMNEDPIRKSIEKIFKKKVVDGCIQEALLDQCICGNKEFVKDNFGSFISLAEHLLSSKEEKAREFGSHIYTRLFEGFADNYSRQEILGALVTHVGSDNNFEVSSVLEMMTVLAKKYAQQLLPFSSHINGILDYLEGFTVENLHKVYEVFSLLALSARASPDSFRSSVSNELMMIVRKQISHPELKYQKMGLVGTLRIVSSLGDATSVPDCSSSQVSDCGEILELLKTSVDSCRQSNLALIIFYDEFAAILNQKLLQPEIMEWIASGSMHETCSGDESLSVKIPQLSPALAAQRFKFRPLLPQCLSILKFPKVQSQNIRNPEYKTELPLYLYLLQDLHTKLDSLVPPGKLLPFKRGSPPGNLGRFKLVELVSQIKGLFPSLRMHLNTAMSLLIKGEETSQTIWRDEFAKAGNPNTSNIVVSDSLIYTMVCKEVLLCFSKMLTLPGFETDKSLLLDLLEAFQPTDIPVDSFADLQPFPSPGTKDYLFIGVYCFFEDILNNACSFSFDLAFECLLTLQLVVTSAQKYIGKVSEEVIKKRCVGPIQGLVPSLHAKLGTSAEKLLRHEWIDETTDNKGLKNKGEMVQNILRIYLETSGSTSDLLDELACTILPQASLSKSTGEDDAHDHEFPTLCSATFRGWYKTLVRQILRYLVCIPVSCNRLIASSLLVDLTQEGSGCDMIQ